MAYSLSTFQNKEQLNFKMQFVINNFRSSGKLKDTNKKDRLLVVFGTVFFVALFCFVGLIVYILLGNTI